MKNNILIIIISIALYAIAFRAAALVFEQYLIYFKGPVLQFILIEQSLIPFLFGYFVYKALRKKQNISPLTVIIVPIMYILLSLVYSYSQGVNLYKELGALLFSTIVFLQLVFITVGSYAQLYKSKS